MIRRISSRWCARANFEKKQQGISFLLIDLKTPGITIRPILNLAGEDEFCEVFFDEVRVPRENLVGGLHEGWAVAKALLGHGAHLDRQSGIGRTRARPRGPPAARDGEPGPTPD